MNLVAGILFVLIGLFMLLPTIGGDCFRDVACQQSQNIYMIVSLTLIIIGVILIIKSATEKIVTNKKVKKNKEDLMKSEKSS